MKLEIYNAAAALNCCFAIALESLAIMEQEGTLAADYVQHQREIIEETLAGINAHIHEVRGTSELEDWYHFSKLRREREERLKSS